jgi:hypothetical protein
MRALRQGPAVIRLSLIIAGSFYAGACWAMRCIDEMTAVGR